MDKLLVKQMEALITKEDWLITNLSNASALLWSELQDINWAGFYLIRDGELVLGPFQGKVACTHIALGKGVCGTAAVEDSTKRIENVHDFPGHIACDSDSNSEIVIPIHSSKGTVVGVLDIDSPLFGRFSVEDQEILEDIVKIVEKAFD